MFELPVIILCGGLGTRLRSAVPDRPKALAPIGEQSFIAMKIGGLRRQFVKRIVLCVGHQAEQIKAELGDGEQLGVRIEYVHDGATLLGTGGAIRNAERYFASAAVVMNGDTDIQIGLAQLASNHAVAAAAGAAATIAVAALPENERYGSVAIDRAGYIRSFDEKPNERKACWVNTGVYVIERALLKHIPCGEASSLEQDIFPAVLRDGLKLSAYTFNGQFTDIGTPEAYRSYVREQEALYAS